MRRLSHGRDTLVAEMRELSSAAFRFVLTMGIVNLFADVTYEGGASINGQYLASLGASAGAVSVIAGVGEWIGYSLRSVSGYVADKTGKWWPLTFLGYVINLLAVPAMAFAGNWPTAAALITAERVGRAIRKPTVDTPCRTRCSRRSSRACCPNTAANAAFGIFYIGYGAGWLVGSVAAGMLYDRSLTTLVMVAVIAKVGSIPWFVAGARQRSAH
jgi:hypothetical protein